MDINRNAPVVVELDITVNAPLETVWNLHTDIDAWSKWNADITRAHLRGELRAGTVFDWETAGLAITSTVAEVSPMGRIAWGGPAHSIDGIHVWTFEATEAGVVVRTRESWDGEPVLADPAGMHAALEGSLRTWLDELKSVAERGTGTPTS
jgi:uncharacterized protein YndB with AHSA1/START domain